MITTLPSRSAAKAFFTETEAAEALGISLDRFRDLVKTHIAQSDEEVNNIGATTYQASDLLVLKLLALLVEILKIHLSMAQKLFTTHLGQL